jgi:YhcH/YjgK/YiaL family protein
MILDYVRNTKLYENISPNLKLALNFIREKEKDIASMDAGKYELDGDKVTVTIKRGYSTKAEEECKWESHKRYIDIQYLFTGQEVIGYCPAWFLDVKTPYVEDRDVIIYHPTGKGTKLRILEGAYVILFPDDAHMALQPYDTFTTNNKAVFKVKV